MTKLFRLGDVLSFTTGRMLSPIGMEGVYRLAEYLAGGPVYTIRSDASCVSADRTYSRSSLS